MMFPSDLSRRRDPSPNARPSRLKEGYVTALAAFFVDGGFDLSEYFANRFVTAKSMFLRSPSFDETI
jgi:hypothetical protein